MPTNNPNNLNNPNITGVLVGISTLSIPLIIPAISFAVISLWANPKNSFLRGLLSPKALTIGLIPLILYFAGASTSGELRKDKEGKTAAIGAGLLAIALSVTALSPWNGVNNSVVKNLISYKTAFSIVTVSLMFLGTSALIALNENMINEERESYEETNLKGKFIQTTFGAGAALLATALVMKAINLWEPAKYDFLKSLSTNKIALTVAGIGAISLITSIFAYTTCNNLFDISLYKDRVTPSPQLSSSKVRNSGTPISSSVA